MNEPIYLVGRIIIGIVGAFLGYVALFLYETEEKEIQNRLEEMWVQIFDNQKHSVPLHIAFIRAIYTSILSLFKRVFGERSFSLQSIGFSIAYVSGINNINSGIARMSQNLTLYPLYLWTLMWHGIMPNLMPVFLHNIMPVFIQFIMGILTIFMGFFPSKRKYDKKNIWGWFLMILIIVAFQINREKFIYYHNTFDFFLAYYFLPTLYLVLSNIYLQFGIQKVIDSSSSDFFKKSIIFIWLPFLFVVLVLLFVVLNQEINIGQIPMLDILLRSLFVALPYVIVVLVIFMSLSAVLVLHLFTWPLIKRSVYALQRIGVVKRRKLFGFVGLALLLFAFGVTPERIIAIFSGIP